MIPNLKPLADHAWAICVLNRNEAPRAFAFDWNEESVSDDVSGPRLVPEGCTLPDLRNHKDLGGTGAVFETVVPGHDVFLLRLDRK